MAKLKFFDCNCTIGRVGYPAIYDISDADGLLKEMSTAGIEEALVYHIIARDGHPPLGNDLLMEAIKDYEQLHPVWVVMPHHTKEMPSPEKLLQEMKENVVKAVRIYPTRSHHSFSIEKWCAGDLLDALEQAGIPLILDMEILSWDDVHTILKNYSQLPVIAANCTYRHNRFIYPLLERFDNLYIELSRFMGAGAVEDMVERFGSRPLLFGTNMPHYTGTAAVALLTYSDIDQKDKQAIAGENLRHLIREVWK
jgi:predicted TIM-barrel fold metal-dependent hydrolase